MAGNNLSNIRGNPNLEKLLGQAFSGMMPSLPSLPSQSMQGGKGKLAKMALGHGFDKQRRFGLLNESQKSFLARYAGGLKYDPKPAISTADLLKM